MHNMISVPTAYAHGCVKIYNTIGMVIKITKDTMRFEDQIVYTVPEKKVRWSVGLVPEEAREAAVLPSV